MKISLITVTYNSGDVLRCAIESVLRQTYPNIEYIIVDGASKDNTLDIIRTYEPKFNGRMRWISEPDRGLYDAMNKGIRMATGDVIGILNSDDFFTSDDVLQKVAEGFADSEVDAVYGDIHFVHADDLNRCVRYYSSKIFRRGLMRLGFIPAHPSFYCRRECFEKYGEYKEPKGDSKKVSSSLKKTSSVVSSSSVASSSSESSVSSSSSSTKKNKGEYTTYTVKSGDYLSTIASKYGTTTQELMDLNDLASGTINPGQELKVPANSSNDQDSSSADSSSQGDSDN